MRCQGEECMHVMGINLILAKKIEGIFLISILFVWLLINY